MRLALACALLALTTASCGGAEATDPERKVDKVEAVEVRYFVEGSARSVSVTFETPTGTQQHGGLSLPMTGTDGKAGVFFDTRPGAFIYVSAQNDGEDGSVVCRIEVDGELVSENHASGAYSIATCKGSA